MQPAGQRVVPRTDRQDRRFLEGLWVLAVLSHDWVIITSATAGRHWLCMPSAWTRLVLTAT